jgi:hypothetical protein
MYENLNVKLRCQKIKSANAWKDLLIILCCQYHTVPFTTHDIPPPTLDKVRGKNGSAHNKILQ